MADSIKIVVRVRPFNEREITNNFKNCVTMDGQQLRITNPEALDDDPRKFAFHRCYYSTDDAMGHPPVNNKEVFEDIGKQVLECIYQGYNSTIFAYGQTGSGKSYSIEGREAEKGLLQMCLEDIFNRRKPQNNKNGLVTSVKVTYVEIYNQKLRDLVNPEKDKEPRVVQIGTAITIHGVDPLPINSYEEGEKVFNQGKAVRVVGGTAMNKNSSRSHALFTIHYKETGKGKMIDAKFNIVDLAGSERQTKTGATGKRLEEANNINRSLTNLGIVIEKLAHNCMNKKNEFIPYRNSLLTHILSESLAGNSKTFMIAAISPADDNYDESVGTLKFAQRASLISTQTKKNVSAKEGYNKELITQIQKLKKELEEARAQAGSHSHSVNVEYITIDKEASMMDGRIAGMMQELSQNKSEREGLEFKLQELEEERKGLEMERSKKNLLDPEEEQRVKVLDKQIAQLKEHIKNSKKSRDELENQLTDEKTKRQSLDKELTKAHGDISEEQSKAAELNARILMMTTEVDQNKADKESLMKELEQERKQKEQIDKNRKKLLEEAGLSQQSNISEKKFPYIMNTSEDPTLLGMLLYDIKEGETKVGTKDAEQNQIKINVLGIMMRHCSFYNKGGSISIEPYPEAKVFVNGILTSKKRDLNHLDRVTLGHANNFKLIIPGKSTGDELRQSNAAPGKFGEYIDDKIAANTIEAKSIKQFLTEMQQRLEKHLFSKFLEKFKTTLEDVDMVNQFTYERYRKFPLRTKNLHFRIDTLVDPENYMKAVPQLVVICEQKETRELIYMWSEAKFQKRLSDMEAWYQGTGGKDIALQTSEFDPWFEPTDHYLSEKAQLEHMKPRQAVQLWQKKQAQNSQSYKGVQAEINAILKDFHTKGYSESVIEDYADYYFRNFPPPESVKSKVEDMRKNEEIHKTVHRYMECYAELKECEINNKFFNVQRGKYMRGKQPEKAPEPQPQPQAVPVSAPPPPPPSGGGNTEALDKQIVWLNTKVEELQQEIKRQAKIIRKGA